SCRASCAQVSVSACANGAPTLSAGSASRHVLAAVGIEASTRDETCFVRREEGHATRHFLGGAEPADGDLRDDLRLEDLFRHGCDHLGGDVAWCDDVAGDAFGSTLLSE